jgi:hypothetical protein
MADPEFGPRGYLPERAAKRARKIILREQMGMGWPLAAVVAGLLLLVLGAVYLITRTGPPGEPFTAVAQLDEVDPRSLSVLPAGEADVLVVRAGGGVRAFLTPDTAVAFCPESRRIEGADGSVWTVGGRVQTEPGASLRPLPVVVYDGQIYVDAGAPGPPPPPDPAEVVPMCASD